MAESTLMEQALRQGEFIKEVWRISGVAMRMEAGGKDQKVDKNNRELTSVQNGAENRAQELSAQALETWDGVPALTYKLWDLRKSFLGASVSLPAKWEYYYY